MGYRHRGAIAALLLVVSLAPPVHAQATAVDVAVPCAIEGTTVAEIVAILRAQLAPMPVEPSSLGEGSLSNVQVTVDGCQALGEDLELVVEHRGRRHSLRLDMADVAPIARSRTLALALAESIQHALPSLTEDENSSAPPAALPPAPPVALPPAPAGSAGDEPSVAGEAPATPGPSTQPSSLARANYRARAIDGGVGGPATFELFAEPVARYAIKTSTPYAGIDIGTGVGRFNWGLRALAGRREVQSGAVWQGALLGVLSADWLAIAAHSSIRSEVEVGAAFATASGVQSSVSRSARSPHWGVATYLRLDSPLSGPWALTSELGIGVASSLTSQTYHVDTMSLSGLFLQASFGVCWGSRSRPR